MSHQQARQFDRAVWTRWLFLASCLMWPAATMAQDSRMPKLAPGVLRTIPAFSEEAETVTGPRPIRALTEQAEAWKPNYLPENQTLGARAGAMIFRRPVWQLEYSFKPMRLLTVDNSDGTRRRIWYMLYKVSNTGRHLMPVAEPDEFGYDTFSTKPGTKTIRFFPMFVVKAHEFDKSYADRLIPGIKQRIHAIEIKDPRVTLHDSVSITKVEIKPSTDTVDRGVWGVATWPAVDRRTDFFSVYVQGLSNAYQWEDVEGEDPRLTYKTLQLNFWRPGDPVLESEKEFRYGIPALPSDPSRAKAQKMYGMTDMSEYTWTYLP